jgi:lipopolysaccharide transport system ATP-binding protein
MKRAKARIAKLIEASEILILATHDFGSLRDICARALVFHHGEVKFDGTVESAIKEYRQLIGVSA